MFRGGQYRKSTLVERYGADMNMVELRLILAAGCPKIEANKIMDLCGQPVDSWCAIFYGADDKCCKVFDTAPGAVPLVPYTDSL